MAGMTRLHVSSIAVVGLIMESPARNRERVARRAESRIEAGGLVDCRGDPAAALFNQAQRFRPRTKRSEVHPRVRCARMRIGRSRCAAWNSGLRNAALPFSGGEFVHDLRGRL